MSAVMVQTLRLLSLKQKIINGFIIVLSSIASLMAAVAIVVASVIQVSMYLPRSGNSDKIYASIEQSQLFHKMDL